MQTVTGLYDSYDDARTVVNKLEDAGISSSDISIVGRDGETDKTMQARVQQRAPG